MSKSKDEFATRMKMYESMQTQQRVMFRLPVCVRLDGRKFSNFTRGLKRPFDEGMSQAMIKTAEYLLTETKAKIAYTQSDEITLLYSNGADLDSPKLCPKSVILFGGRFFKLMSVLPAMAAAKFNSLLPTHIPSKAEELPAFDCRAWQVPNLVEAANVLLWRWFDARKNSVSMAAQSVYSSKQLYKKHRDDQLGMLLERGIDWNEYPAFFKWGTFLQRRSHIYHYSMEELAKIPEKHREGTKNAVRHKAIALDLPPFNKVLNRVDVVFYEADPITADQIGDDQLKIFELMTGPGAGLHPGQSFRPLLEEVQRFRGESSSTTPA